MHKFIYYEFGFIIDQSIFYIGETSNLNRLLIIVSSYLCKPFQMIENNSSNSIPCTNCRWLSVKPQCIDLEALLRRLYGILKNIPVSYLCEISFFKVVVYQPGISFVVLKVVMHDLSYHTYLNCHA